MPKRPQVCHTRWTGAHFNHGTCEDTLVAEGVIALTQPQHQCDYQDPWPADPTVTAAEAELNPARRYEYGSWTSGWVSAGFAFSQLFACWNAITPNGSWVELQIRVRTQSEQPTDWYVLGRWASHDVADGGEIMRTSVADQQSEHVHIDQDVFQVTGDAPFDQAQVRVLLLRPVGSDVAPTVSLISLTATAEGDEQPLSEPGPGRGVVLDVPALSQQVHCGHYPQWGGGGKVWCSPTSVAMVLRYWAVGPDADELAWVDPPVDAIVDHGARNSWDYAYRGAGNWPFGTAYAARYGLRAWATALRSLRDAEEWIASGVPLVISLAHAPGELDGAGYHTEGHLMVVIGFTEDGDVVVNDPASHELASNDEVRVTYRRDQLERLWLEHSRGACYIILPVDHPRAATAGR